MATVHLSRFWRRGRKYDTIYCTAVQNSCGGRKDQRLASTCTHHGEVGTPEFAVRFQGDDNKPISPWHDVPLRTASGAFNFLCEIPRLSKAKLEVDTKSELNPIVQDVKKGKMRYYHGPIYWNYGCLPQTWEDPNVRNEEVKYLGDNDPLDVVEIGSSALEIGSVTPVKPLGVLSMIDDGELDWKLLAISTSDPLASAINDVGDIDQHMPGTVSGIREWFRWYKVPDGKPVNKFGHNEEALGTDKALHVIEETHAFWKRLVEGKAEQGKLWVPR